MQGSSPGRALWIAFGALYVIGLLSVPVEFMLWTLVDMWILGVGIMLGMLAGVIAFLVQLRRRVLDPARRQARMSLAELLGRMAVGAVPIIVLVSAAYAINCGTDPSPNAPRRVQVLGMSTSSGKSKSHNLELQSWRAPEEVIKVRVDEETWNQIKAVAVEKRAVMIEAHPGRLGFAWYRSIEPAALE